MALAAKDIPMTQIHQCHLVHIVAWLVINLVMHLHKLLLELAMQGWGHIRRMVLKDIHTSMGVNITSSIKVNLHIMKPTEHPGEGEGITLDHRGVLPKIQGGQLSIVTIVNILGGSRCSYFTSQTT